MTPVKKSSGQFCNPGGFMEPNGEVKSVAGGGCDLITRLQVRGRRRQPRKRYTMLLSFLVVGEAELR